MYKLLLVVAVACIGINAVTVQQALTTRCDTGSVRGLSRQLIDQINCLAPGAMTDMTGSSGINFGANAFPYLQTNAANALKRAVSQHGGSISVNSALRSLPQQYLLYSWHVRGRCNQRKPAARPGGSNHNGGAAIDIEDNVGWKAALESNSWKWFGSTDRVHFTYRGSTVDIKGLSVKAFCQLWNFNNPSDTIPETTAFNSVVERKLLISPAEGFDREPSGCGAKRFSEALMANATEVKRMEERQDAAENYGPCYTSDGIAGTCIQPSACAAQSGVVQSGQCAAPNDIKCCVLNYQAPTTLTQDSPRFGSSVKSINQNGVHLIQSFEHYKDRFYIDAVGIKTIGYGHACHVSDCRNLQGKTESGSMYRLSVPLSLQEANDLMRADLDNLGFEDCVNRYVTANINDDQFSALVSFTFTVGCSILQRSTLLTRVNQNAAVEGAGGIREAWVRYNKGNGRVLAGLTRRRNAECDLFAGRYQSRSSLARDLGLRASSVDTDGTGADCWHYGQKGVCLPTAKCSGFRVEGLCPNAGAKDIQCCLRAKCDATSAGSQDGMCGLAALCSTGKINTAVNCTGATDLKCCAGNFPEPTTSCPEGATWAQNERWCLTNDGQYALGPFTRAMNDKCSSTGNSDEICVQKYPFVWNGENLLLHRWPIDIARRIRGTDNCPLGTTADSGYLGYCLEEINVIAPNTTDDIISQRTVYGAMTPDIIEGCKQFSGGLACNTPRFDGDFFRTIANTFAGAIVTDYENSTATTRDDSSPDAVFNDHSSNSWAEISQNRLSDEHAPNGDEVNSSSSVVACIAIVFMALMF